MFERWLAARIFSANTSSNASEGIAAGTKFSLSVASTRTAVQYGTTLQELQVLGDWKSYRSVLKYAFLAPENAVSAAESVARWAHTGTQEGTRSAKQK